MHSWPPLNLVALLKAILWQIKHGSPTFKKKGCFNILALFCSLFGKRKKRKRHKTKKEGEMWEEGKEGGGIRKHGCAAHNSCVTFVLFHVKIILFLPPQNKSSCKLSRLNSFPLCGTFVPVLPSMISLTVTFYETLVLSLALLFRFPFPCVPLPLKVPFSLPQHF